MGMFQSEDGRLTVEDRFDRDSELEFEIEGQDTIVSAWLTRGEVVELHAHLGSLLS